MRDQQLLHAGYLRLDVLGVDPELTNIPKDIIHLSLKFVQLDVRAMYNEIGERFADDRGRAEDWQQVRNAYSLAEEFAKHWEHFMAHQILDTLIAWKPGFGNLHFAMGAICEEWGIPNKADTSYRKAIELDSDSVHYRYFYGLFLQQRRKYVAALEHFLAAKEARPDEPKYVFEVAFTMQMLRRWDMAAVHFSTAVQLAPKQAAYHRMYAQLLSSEMGELQKAKGHYLKAIELEPTICDHRYWFATHLRDDYREYEEAEKQYISCLELDPHDAGVHGSYGYLLYLMREYEKAKLHLEIAVDANGQRVISVWSFYYMSLVHRALGDEGEADQWMEEAVRHCVVSDDVFKKYFDRIKAADPQNMDHHVKFERLVAMMRDLEKEGKKQGGKCPICSYSL